MSTGFANQVVTAEPLRTSDQAAFDPGEKRNLSLDGLRGIAVLLVLFHHHHYLESGWMGVDLFFVLSGYLITSILRRTRTDQFYWRNFWIKRFTRILPPFLLLLVATALLPFHLSWKQAAAYLLSFGDVLAYTRPNFEPLRSLWSLAVEEHFYMLWPFAVRFLPRRSLLIILFTLLILEPVTRGIISQFVADWQFFYFLTPFRLDGLALGSLLALLSESESSLEFLKHWSGWATLLFAALWFCFRITFGLSFTRDNPTAVYNSACYSLVSLVAFSLIAWLVTRPCSVATAALGWKPLVFTGVISYGLYLYQVMLRELVMSTWHVSIRNALWIDTPILFLAAWISFRFYEQPLIRWGKRLTQNLY